MERPSLRPVPARPPRGADPAEALRHVSATLPDLDQSAAGALALVELVGRSRAAAAAELGIERGQLAELLARSRKQLRRTLFPLGASGWCERAERLISDRIDGELRPPGPARLDAHLRNCDRCVEHERRLDQARDGLIQAFAAGHPEPAPLAPPERPRAEPERPVPAPATTEPPAAHGASEAPTIDPPVQPEPEIEPPPIDPPQPPQEPVARPALEPRTPLPQPALAGVGFAAQAAWGFMYALAIVLTLAAIALTVVGATGTTVT